MTYHRFFLYFFGLLTLSSQTLLAQAWEKRVYLATYPRSGNHWVRYVIEEATHIATSSVYLDGEPTDNPHLYIPFPWGGYCANHGYKRNCRYPKHNEPFVIKTHYPALGPLAFDQQPYIKTICIVRHPLDSFYSYYTYLSNGKPPVERIALDQLNDFIYKWFIFHNHWNKAKNVLMIRYEDLYQQPKFYFKQILDAVGYSVTDEDLDRAIAKFPPTGGLNRHQKHYLPEDVEYINFFLEPLLKQYDYRMPTPQELKP